MVRPGTGPGGRRANFGPRATSTRDRRPSYDLRPGCGEIEPTRQNDPHGELGGDGPGVRRPHRRCSSCRAGSSCAPSGSRGLEAARRVPRRVGGRHRGLRDGHPARSASAGAGSSLAVVTCACRRGAGLARRSHPRSAGTSPVPTVPPARRLLGRPRPDVVAAIGLGVAHRPRHDPARDRPPRRARRQP